MLPGPPTTHALDLSPGKMALCVKMLAAQANGHEFRSPEPHKKLDLVAYACNPSATATDKHIPGLCLQTGLAKTASSRCGK